VRKHPSVNTFPRTIQRYAGAAAIVLSLATAGCAGTGAAPSDSPLPVNALAQSTAVRSRTTTIGHSMWLWPGASYPPATSVMSWCTSHGVTNVFLYVYTKNGRVGDLNDIRSYAQAATKSGVTLYALNGEAQWILHPKSVIAWENAVNATGLFAGVHLDTEPNQVNGWTSYNKPGAVQADAPIINDMYAMLEAVRTNSPSTHLEVDVQFSDASYTQALGFPTDGYGSFGEALVALTDELTVMSYRTVLEGNNGLVEISAPMLALATAHDKPMRLAIETSKDPPDPQDSFWGHPQSDVRKMLKAVDSAQASSTAYDGTSVEEYVSWTELQK
jgi:hypothetical protein